MITQNSTETTKVNVKDIIKVEVDKYNLEEEWLSNIGKKYLNVDNVNKLKVGLFGYINEVMSTEVKNATAHRNFLYDEAFLNTASMTKSIYNKAKSYNYEIPLATPSSFYITFAIKEEDILKYGTKQYDATGKLNGNIVFNISPETTFSLDTYSFMLEHGINIQCTRLASGEYSYIARYDFSDSYNNKSYFDSTLKPYIQLWIDRDEVLGNVISLGLRLYQIKKKSQVFENFSTDMSDNLMYTVKYTDQLAKFNVIYEINGKKTYLRPYFNDTFVPSDEQFCYYTFSDNELKIFFSSLPNCFRPTLNSKLTIETFSCMGKEGNFNYEKHPNFSLVSNSTKNKVMAAVFKESDPIGGNDLPTPMQIKQDLMYQFLTRDNLITEFDLNSFFTNIIRREAVNSSEMLFIKKRDDILKRLFGVYLLLRDKTGLIIPTNTVDLELDKSIESELMIPSGSFVTCTHKDYVVFDESKMSPDDYEIIEFPDDSERYVLFNPDTMVASDFKEIIPKTRYFIIDESEINKHEIVYKVPFMYVYKYSPFPRVLAINTNIDRKFTYAYDFVNASINAEFILSQLKLFRNPIKYENNKDFNKYTLSFTLDTTLPKLTVEQCVKIRGVFKNKDDEYSGYFDFDIDATKKIVFSKSFESDDHIDDENRMCLINSVKAIQSGMEFEKFYIDESVSLELFILYKDSTDKDKVRTGILEKMVDINEYSLAVKMTSDVKLSMFNILNDVMNPILSFKDPELTEGIYIKSVPVIGYHYFKDYEIYKNFYQIFNIYYDMLKSNFAKLENNTGLDIKFYNTYGYSRHFSSKRTHLNLKLDITLNGIYTKNLDFKIKNFIVEFAEQVNNTTNKTFAMSNLIHSLEQSFEDIDYIEFISLNDKEEQKILHEYPDIKKLNREQLIKYVPEYLNILIGEESYYGDPENFKVDIKINYK